MTQVIEHNRYNYSFIEYKGVELEAKLLNFLKIKKCLDPFIENVLGFGKFVFDDSVKVCGISEAFPWNESQEGHEYWMELHKEFRLHLFELQTNQLSKQ